MDKESSIFPICPECAKGNLLPFSFKQDFFEKWKCSSCGYTVNKK